MKKPCIILLGIILLVITDNSWSADVPISRLSDAEIRHIIIGSWKYNSNSDDGITIFTNGLFISKWGQKSKDRAITWKGAWQIKSGVLLLTNTESNSVPTTSVVRCELIDVDSKRLIYQNDTEFKITLIRQQ
jgi:hypothetical protein